MIARIGFIFSFASWFSLGLAALAESKAAFSVIFDREEVVLSGPYPSKEFANSLAAAILSAKPNLRIINDGIIYTKSADFPNETLLINLINELALSTHDGAFVMTDSTITLSGITDSIVTTSALQLRSKSLLGNRVLREQICLVPTEDLPTTEVVLSTGETRKSPRFDLDLVRTDRIDFEPPGVMPTKLAALLLAFDDLPWVVETEPSSTPADSTNVSPRPKTDQKDDPYFDIETIRFSRNSHSLQTGQDQHLKMVANTLNSPKLQNRPIMIRSLIYPSNSAAYSKWLSEKRSQATAQKLIDLGIAKNRIQQESTPTKAPIDVGTVKVQVLKTATGKTQ